MRTKSKPVKKEEITKEELLQIIKENEEYLKEIKILDEKIAVEWAKYKEKYGDK